MKNIIGILGVFILAISCSGGKKESADAGLELTEELRLELEKKRLGN